VGNYVTDNPSNLGNYVTADSPRRGVGKNYAEVYGMQQPDGSLIELSIRAELDVWEHNQHQRWDDPLSSADARRRASQLVNAAGEFVLLASAFLSAADELDGIEVTR
jgi:hypothetical protein